MKPVQPFELLGITETRNALLLRELCIVFYRNSSYDPTLNAFHWDIGELLRWVMKVCIDSREVAVLSLQIGKLTKDVTFCIAIREEGERLSKTN